MNQYEIAVLYDPDLEIDLDKAEEHIKKIITGNGGKVVTVDNWGKRLLAYPIKKHESAVYVFYTVELDPNNVLQIEADLNVSSEVIRFLITKPDLKRRAKADAEKEYKAKRNAEQSASNEAEDDQE